MVVQSKRTITIHYNIIVKPKRVEKRTVVTKLMNLGNVIDTFEHVSHLILFLGRHLSDQGFKLARAQVGHLQQLAKRDVHLQQVVPIQQVNFSTESGGCKVRREDSEGRAEELYRQIDYGDVVQLSQVGIRIESIILIDQVMRRFNRK